MKTTLNFMKVAWSLEKTCPYYSQSSGSQSVLQGLLRVPKTFSGDPQGQNDFLINTKVLFASYIVLTFARMMQKQ